MGDGLAVFFDIGDTLASPHITGGHLAGLDVYPFIPQILARMRAAGAMNLQWHWALFPILEMRQKRL
jgi:hypothetical protein